MKTFEERISFLQEVFGSELGNKVRQILNDSSIDEMEQLQLVNNTIFGSLSIDFDVAMHTGRRSSTSGYGNVCNILFSKEKIETLKKASRSDIAYELNQIDEFSKYILKHKGNSAAVTTALTTIGVTALGGVVLAISPPSAVVGIAVITAVAITSCFTFLAAQEKYSLGLVINDTHKDVVVWQWEKGMDGQTSGSDLYLHHGKMLEFMNDDSSGTNVQIRCKPNENEAYAGLFFMTKRDSALVGVEATMCLRVGEDIPDNKVFFLSSCPYGEDNRVNLAPFKKTKMSTIHSALYANKMLECMTHTKNIVVQAKVNDFRGTPSYAIAYITDKPIDETYFVQKTWRDRTKWTSNIEDHVLRFDSVEESTLDKTKKKRFWTTCKVTVSGLGDIVTFFNLEITIDGVVCGEINSKLKKGEVKEFYFPVYKSCKVHVTGNIKNSGGDIKVICAYDNTK